MTNERHEKALEAAAWCGDIDWAAALADSQFASTPKAVEAIIASYVKAMDAVIVPKEPTEEMQKASRIVIDLRGVEVSRVTTWGINAWESILAAAPNHFTNGE